MPVFSSRKKKLDEYYCKIFTMDSELQFTIEVSRIYLLRNINIKSNVLGNS